MEPKHLLSLGGKKCSGNAPTSLTPCQIVFVMNAEGEIQEDDGLPLAIC